MTILINLHFHTVNILYEKNDLFDIIEVMSKKKKIGFWEEFMSFAMKGNMIDLAIGIIIGTAFNDLVQSFVKDIVMPPLGKILGNVDFSQLYIVLSEQKFDTLAAAERAGAPVIRYGHFITNLIDFVILAFTVFLVLKYILRYSLKAKEEK